MNTETTKIQLGGIRLYGYHGVSDEEQSVGSWFEINVSLETHMTDEALASDDINRTINYAEVLDVIKGVFAVKSRLLEHVAYAIAQKLCSAFDTVSTVSIQVKKLAPPVTANVGYSAVELTVRA
jgi:7,8-dihydroneopterin aldolase/epimerase/oxygenase